MARKDYEIMLLLNAKVTNDLRQQLVEMNKQFGLINNAGQQQQSTTQGIIGKVKSWGSALSGAYMSIKSIVEGVRMVVGAFVQISEPAAKLEHAMSAVEALTEASQTEMQQLTDLAKELGANTIYTAEQVANAMEYMGMAGWTAEDMLSGMEGVIMLAASSGEDLAMVSDIVTDNLTAFGLTAKDTGRFVDVLAQAATKSNTDVEVMGETFKNAAAVAGALGYSVEDVSVAVGVMANAGVKGSIAGTALRNIFNGMLNGATLTGKAIGEINFTSKNTDGTMKSLAQSVDELRYYFGKMTEAEKITNAETLAGMRGYNGLLAILNATDEEYQALYESVHNASGAAEKMADIRLDNLMGDVTILTSAWDALVTTVGEKLLPMERGAVQGLTGIITKVNELLKPNQTLQEQYKTMMEYLQELDGITLPDAEGIIEAVAAEKRTDVMRNLTAQAGEYIATLKEQEGIQERISQLSERYSGITSMAQGPATETIRADYQALMEDIREYGLESTAWEERLKALSEQVSLITGKNIQFNTTAAVQDWLDSDAPTAKEQLENLAAIQDEIDLSNQEIAKQQEEQTLRLQNMAQAVREGYVSMEWLEAMLRQTLGTGEDYEAAMVAVERAMSGLEDGTDSAAQSVEDLQTAFERWGMDGAAYATEQVQLLTGSVDEMIGAYEQAYDTAYNAFGLWETIVPTQEQKTSLDEMHNALWTQVSYMEQYLENLEQIKSWGAGGALLASLSGGSQEQAQLLAALVEAGEEAAQNYFDVWENVQDMRGGFAEELATLGGDYDEAMNDMALRAEELVEELSQEQEAMQAGYDTMMAYAEGLDRGGGYVERVMADILEGVWGGRGARQTAVTAVRENAPTLTPYADGGIATSPRIGLVAEAGVPEAMIPWNGSRRSVELWQATGQALGVGGNITFAPVIHMAGTDPEELMRRMRSMFLDLIRQQQRSSARVTMH